MSIKQDVSQILVDRTKELNCLFEVEKILNSKTDNFEIILNELLTVLPTGFHNPDHYSVKIIIKNRIYQLPASKDSNFCLIKDIKIKDEYLGLVYVYYHSSIEIAKSQAFTSDEEKLISTFADRLGYYIYFLKIKKQYEVLQEKNAEFAESSKPEWYVVLDITKRTDQNLFSILSRKMLNHLFCKGVKESTDLFIKMGSSLDFDETINPFTNRPSKKSILQQSFKFGFEIFDLAAIYFNDDEIMNRIQKWIHEEKSHYLLKLLANQNTSLADINDGIRRYHQINPTSDDDNSSTAHGIKVALIRRFLTDSLDFIDIAKSYCDVDDFYAVIHKMIFPPESHGKLGGKGSGLFLAKKIIEKSTEFSDTLADVKYPKTWYITSDGLMNFMYYNNMEDVIEQKYKDIDEIRQEYPHIIQAFKNSQFSMDITNGLSRALDDFGDNPIIVRSSSLLEDRMGAVFAGKYKSLFLANQGSKQQRMEELMDAIAEVYASIFGPDPIGYRIERGFLDFNEEMAIMIQEVVGKKVGKYFFPAFAGVAFSYNEYRWTPRIKREDGLVRIVPGLGTRAVDRVGIDFPILISPGQPNLRVNQTFQEVVGYSPKYVDLINLEKNTFETVSIKQLIDEIGNNFPMINDIFSIVDGSIVKKPIGLGIDTRKHDIVVTFDNLIAKRKYIEQIKVMIHELNDKLGSPVDIEFACDGTNLYLLQCRPQSSSADSQSAVIPKDVPENQILFSSNKYISNGRVPDIQYIVYVDPDNYKKHKNLDDLVDIGKAVGKLNKMLPRRSFILMGPGRWGSRDDIRLGVKVTYSDLHNTAMLIEIAKTGENYTPELSFGTHFFQDLVEAEIRYLPLYPDINGGIFNQDFLMHSENTLTRFLPEFDHLEGTLKVINVMESTGGLVLRILLNGDDDEALAFFVDETNAASYKTSSLTTDHIHNSYDEPLQWRKRMAESVGLKLDPERFGVKAVYLFGTVFHDTAGPNSDIDFLVHFEGNESQFHDLKLWFEGWNLCLSQINYYRSGYSVEKVLDITYISESDFEDQKYYVDLMNPSNHSSKKLRLKNQKR
jgi:hypothetical protein